MPKKPVGLDNIANMLAKGREEARKRVECNKQLVFDIFDINGVDGAELRFDGSGDSGGVEEFTLYDKNGITGSKSAKLEALKEEPVIGAKILNCTRFTENGCMEVLEEGAQSLENVINGMVYDMLKAEHEGWENNDGAYGTINFDTTSRKIMLEYYERATEYHEHEF